ncbi:MAG: PQQ-binding-like beta-propeller repeat protein, partial [Pseudomonadota bacterium]|nr:PQQ-binding-like beta-propeller repeat protein [Pseudomonadota bacterium]
MNRHVAVAVSIIATFWNAYPGLANEPGADIYQRRCAVCHTGTNKNTGPSLDSIQAMSSAEIRFTLLEGKMKGHASSLSDSQLESLLRFLVGDRPDAPIVIGSSTACSNNPISFDATMTSWGFNAQNTRHQSHTLINTESINRLELAWSFGLPETSTARSQPIITDNTVFVASTSGHVYALDRASGCERWHYRSENPLRTSLTLGTVNSSPALFIGDQR